MLLKTSLLAAAALAASQANAMSAHRRKHHAERRKIAVDQGVGSHKERDLEERAIVHKYTKTEYVTKCSTIYVSMNPTATPDAVQDPPTPEVVAEDVPVPAEPKPEMAKDPAPQPPPPAPAPPSPSPQQPEPAPPQQPEPAPPQQPEPVANEPEPEDDEEPEQDSQPAPPPPAGGSNGGSSTTCKRGIAYNNEALTPPFTSSDNICWGYNWGNSGSLSGAEFIPTLWGNKASFFQDWPSKAAEMIAAGSEHLFSFNEPDMTGQAGDALGDPGVAAAAHIELMNPLSSNGVKIGAPSITSDWNGDGQNGRALRSYHWLKQFMNACDSRGGCAMDFINTHFYGDCNVDIFKGYINDLHSQIPNLPIWVTEFQGECDEANQAKFITETATWMDSTDFVTNYAYFFVDGVLSDGNAPSALGRAYIDA